ncbi:MAG: PepSY domain-containing protein [Planctomycetaceae bacterium]|nr:PepSY domain-containing protein [Planctomycetaceae bacterium]
MWRRFLYKIHLWLGIISGIVLFVVCLSGTLWVLHQEISNFFERDSDFVSLPDKLPLNIDELVAKVEQNTKGKVFIVNTLSRQNDTAYYMIVKKEDSNNIGIERKFHNEFHLINPYTGEILVKRPNPLNGFFHNIIILHRTLFLPQPYGRIIVGSATLIFIIVALSGFCLWLPANFYNKKAWTNSFLVRFRKGKKHLFCDLHKTLGVCALIPMLVMALTGLTWSFQWYNNGIRTIFHAQYVQYPPIKSPPKYPNAKRLPLKFFAKKADELIEQKGFRNFYIPEHEDSPVVVREVWRGTLKLEAWERIHFDQYTGEVLRFERFKDLPVGAKLGTLFYQLHTGNILGLPTKIIYFFACLFATTLPVTGVIIWFRKLRKLRKAKNKTE